MGDSITKHCLRVADGLVKARTQVGHRGSGRAAVTSLHLQLSWMMSAHVAASAATTLLESGHAGTPLLDVRALARVHSEQSAATSSSSSVVPGSPCLRFAVSVEQCSPISDSPS